LALWHAAGCGKPAETPSAFVVEPEIAPWPVRVGAATVTLRISDAGGHALSGARIALEADMSHAGMRPEFGEAREIAAGRYQGRLTLTMAGDWVVLMHIALPGGRKLERQLEVKGVRAN
jgi:YtkA-like protein